MTPSDQKLADRLLTLPLNLQELVFLWLTYRGIKPVSEVSIRQKRSDKSQSDMLVSWFADAGLVYQPNPRNSDAWFIGKDREKVERISQIFYRFDPDSEYEKGILLGYPEGGAKIYSQNKTLKLGDVPLHILYPGNIPLEPTLKGKYYAPYIIHGIRSDHIQEDTQVAQIWADTIRKDIPVLAKKFEDDNSLCLQSQAKYESRNRKRFLRDSQTVDEIMGYFQTDTTSHKAIFLLALSEFLNFELNDFLFASICDRLIKQLSAKEKSDTEFVNALKDGRTIYRPLPPWSTDDERKRLQNYLECSSL